MRFVIDGYNLLHQLGLAGRYAGPRGWERSRDDLLSWIASAHGGQTDNVIVVFDAENAPDSLEPELLVHEIHVRFARGRLADDLIEEMIKEESQPHQLTVVSSDHRLQEAARRRGCAALDCRQYIDRVIGHSSPHVSASAAPPEAGQAAADDQEHWRREFADLDANEELRRFNRPYEDFERD